jgi:hypothetical protein
MKGRIRIFLLIIVIAVISGCVSAGIHDLEIYTPASPNTGQIEVRFSKALGKLPLFQFHYTKEGLHSGLPLGNEIQKIKTEGAKMGAILLVLDCPSPGVVGYGMCMVYGYE